MFTISGPNNQVREVLGKIWPYDERSNKVSGANRTVVFNVSDAKMADRIRKLLSGYPDITVTESD